MLRRECRAKLSTTSLARADELYAVASNATLTGHRVSNPMLTELTVAVGRLQGALREELDDPYWIDVLRYMRVFLFLVSSTPLPLYNQPLD